MQENYPNLPIDGEMQVNFAMNNELRDRKYPFTRLQGKEVNTLVFPEPEFGQCRLPVAPGSEWRRNRDDRPYPNGVEQTDSFHRLRKFRTRHREHHGRSGHRCHRDEEKNQ